MQVFVKKFPLWDRLEKGQANGLVHAAVQMTSPDNINGLGGTVISELQAVTAVNSNYQRITFPIAILATMRGVSIKEQAAVMAGGASFNPLQMELANGMIKLAQDAQFLLFQGNASNSSGAGATTEAGAYNAASFDGFRGVLGSTGTFAGNNSVITDISTSSITEALASETARIANNGGNPTIAIMSMNAKAALDIEQAANRRYTENTTEIVAGVRVNSIQWANGELMIIAVPGNTMGTYTRASDGLTVEDIYILDESTLKIRWLYSDSWTVIEIPTGVDAVLSDRYICFGMFGLEIAAPLFNGKIRRIAA